MSHPLDPGPYHKANAQLREQLPHYNVDVSVHTRWDHVFLWCMAVVICFVYLGVRLYYLVSGKTAEFNSQNTSVPYSYVVLVGELALGCLGFYGQQCFWKQDVRFSAMDSETLKHISQDTTMNGVRETVHVLITTYTEPAVTVKECVVRCLVAPEPIYMEKHIYVCDDGHAKSEGPKKRAMVEDLRVLGAAPHLLFFFSLCLYNRKGNVDRGKTLICFSVCSPLSQGLWSKYGSSSSLLATTFVSLFPWPSPRFWL